MSRWVPIPLAAMEAVPPEAHGVLTRLYAMADANHWRAFGVSRRTLAHGVSERQAWAAVAALQARGFLVVEVTPRGRTEVTVNRPVDEFPIQILNQIPAASRPVLAESVPASDPVHTRSVNQILYQETRGSSGALAESDPDFVPANSSYRDTQCSEEKRTGTQSDSQRPPPAVSVDGGKDRRDREAFARLAKGWKHYHPGGLNLTPDSGSGRGMMARIRQHGEAAVTTVLRWAHKSNHERAVFLRERSKGLSLETLMRPGHFESYYQFATEEVAVPERPQPPPASAIPRDTRTPEQIEQAIAAAKARQEAREARKRDVG